MNAKLAVTMVAFSVFILLAATAIAQPVPYDQYPYGPDWPSDPNYPGGDYPNYPNDPNYPGPSQDSGSSSGSSGDGGHPTQGPASSEPLSAPSASTTEALNYAEGQSLSLQEVSSSGMMASGNEMMAYGSGTAASGGSMAYMATSGLQIWTRYNGRWTTGPASVFLWRSTSILSYNDQSQRIWSWEGYPRGRQVWRDLGYRMPGYFHGRFTGDERGWHRLAMWGSRSGWSNVLWIYVW